jgi:hypothetical protein
MWMDDNFRHEYSQDKLLGDENEVKWPDEAGYRENAVWWHMQEGRLQENVDLNQEGLT